MRKINFLSIVLLFATLLTISCSKKDDIVVVPKEPVISWANPADIALGILLSASQLNATADVPGAIVYTPALGTKLAEGESQDLKMEFTPTDAVNFKAVSKTVKINVTRFGSVTDVEGNTYKTIIIGTQTWMAENLKTTKYRNGVAISNVTAGASWISITSEAYCWYNFDATNKSTYGALYNWYAVADSRNIAPAGWHIPSDTEWGTLLTYLGGANLALNKLRETGTAHWVGTSTATNESGFTALPGGIIDPADGVARYLGTIGSWWTSTEGSANAALYYYIWGSNASFPDVIRLNYNKQTANSIRCVKD